MIDRNATKVKLAVNGNGVALLTYRSEGRLNHTLAWGAINARTPTRGMKQVKFKLDYSGGWGSHRKAMWKGFRNACGPYEGPGAPLSRRRLHGARRLALGVQKWQRRLPNFGLRPTFEQRAVELHLSHLSGDLPEFVVKVDWVYRHFDHLYGWLTYKGKGVYGFKATSYGSPLDTWGRNVFVDTYNSRYGRGWKRENGFLTHRASGGFCYGFYPHGSRPIGKGEQYRATVMGPGVTPILFWQGAGARPVRPHARRRWRTRSRRRSSRTPSAATSKTHPQRHRIAPVAGDELKALMREVPQPVGVVTVDAAGSRPA